MCFVQTKMHPVKLLGRSQRDMVLGDNQKSLTPREIYFRLCQKKYTFLHFSVGIFNCTIESESCTIFNKYLVEFIYCFKDNRNDLPLFLLIHVLFVVYFIRIIDVNFTKYGLYQWYNCNLFLEHNNCIINSRVQN